MRPTRWGFGLAGALAALLGTAAAGHAANGIERLYVLECGQNLGKDQSRWSPGVKPADVTYVAVSHTHGDHVGNLGLFPASTVLIQGAEYDWAMGQPVKPAFAATQTIDSEVAG